MRRRDFLTLIASIAWPVIAPAQERRVIGFLSAFSGDSWGRLFNAPFIAGLKDTGFVEGRNIVIEYRWADGQYDRLPSLAGELARRPMAVIVTSDIPSSLAAKGATKTIPIVFAIGGDPVEVGLVDNYSRPGGNITGTTSLITVLGAKRLEFAHELISTANTFALLVNDRNQNFRAYATETQRAADALGLHLEVLAASTDSDLEVAFSTAVQNRAGAFIVTPDPFFISRRAQLVALAARHALPTMYPLRDYVDLGGLMSYGAPVTDIVYQSGMQTGKILNGAKPGDLSVHRSTKIELVINLKIAKVLGLTVPGALLARADEVIE